MRERAGEGARWVGGKGSWEDGLGGFGVKVVRCVWLLNVGVSGT